MYSNKLVRSLTRWRVRKKMKIIALFFLPAREKWKRGKTAAS